MSAPPPLTGDELAAIKDHHGKFSADESDPCFWDNPEACLTLRLVAEVERLRHLVQKRGDQAARVRAAEAEAERLRRWKDEALPVLDGLQELGGALGLPLGSRITGRQAVDAALDLRNSAKAPR